MQVPVDMKVVPQRFENQETTTLGKRLIHRGGRQIPGQLRRAGAWSGDHAPARGDHAPARETWRAGAAAPAPRTIVLTVQPPIPLVSPPPTIGVVRPRA